MSATLILMNLGVKATGPRLVTKSKLTSLTPGPGLGAPSLRAPAQGPGAWALGPGPWALGPGPQGPGPRPRGLGPQALGTGPRALGSRDE